MVGVTARLSTDAGNLLTFGSDSGILGTVPASSTSRGGHPFWTADNSWGGTGTQYWYTLGAPTSTSMSLTGGTAWLWPFMVSRPAKVTGLVSQVAVAGAGSIVYNALYGTDSTTGLVGTKISELANFSGVSTGIITGTVTDTTTVLAANTQYWICTWAYTTSGVPQITARQSGVSGSIRINVAPTSTNWWSIGALAYCDTTSGWASRTSAPSTVSLAAVSPTAAGSMQYSPFYYFGLTNT